ncbi:MAG TPA: efflux RND transporter periplasmic adaptor subunit [Pseudomonadales bacterium]|nr:efflux RND transporter periplasmic adaptor subunit [Pseudomonadales bacterium]
MLIKDLATNKNYRTALLILVLSVAWLVSGVFSSHETVAQEDRVTNAQNMVVKVKQLEAVDFIPSLAVKGRTEANRRVVLKAQIGGLLAFRADSEGQVVEAGALLCRLAEEDRALKLQEARSVLTQAKIEYDGALALKTAGYQSKQAIAAAKARMDSASAQLKRRELEMAYLEIRAPFKGVVETFHVEQGDLLNVGTQCASVLELNPLVVVGQVSERVVSQLQPGMPVDVVLAGETTVQGTLRYVASQADAMTRTFKIEALLDNTDYLVRAGLTANISVNLPAVKAHNVPSSLLSLDDAGRMGLKYLDSDNVVHFALVETLADSEAGIWVRGLPDVTTLVTIGQEYVSAGQRVEVSFETSDDEMGR